MREIKFRGKDDNGHWHFGDLSTSKHFPPQIVEGGPYTRFFFVDPDTVGQFTGLTDADGREIYEGDILQIQDDVAEMFRLKNPDFVVYESGSFVLNQIYHDGKLLCALVSLTNTKLHSVRARVIGNVHDNPKLVEVHNAEEMH